MQIIHIGAMLAIAAATLPQASAQNALQRAGQHVTYTAEAQASYSHNKTPLWLTANKYGMSSVDTKNGYLRMAIERQADADSAYHWRFGYGADIAVGAHYPSSGFVQQLYADIDCRLVRLTIGAKQHPMQLKDNELSSGSQALGINAHPVPAVRLSLPRYWNISGRGNWLGIRGHISYGLMTDDNFMQDYLRGTKNRYATRVLLHTKAFYLRAGNAQKFPITYEGGLEWATQFGGTIYNARQTPIKAGHHLKDFFTVLYGGGADVTDGVYSNALGNTLGSWVYRLNYHGHGWGVSIYYDHYFEDHSQMFYNYGWRDGMWGLEAHLPKNPILGKFVYEYIKTTDQSGPIYHDHTPEIPDQVSGSDNYYNHGLYTGWQHWGMAIGNPLYVSPLYKGTRNLSFIGTRFKAHHLGFSGDPLPCLHYRIMITHERNLGNCSSDWTEARTLNSLLLEAAWSPLRLGRINTSGWTAKLAFGLDRGSLIGHNTGAQLTITKNGLITK